MKKSDILYSAVAASMMLFASCSNDQPVFDDADAFVAFTETAMSVDEFGESIEVPVLLSSLAGIEGSVEVTVDTENSTAIEGVHYTFGSSSTLNFTKDAPTQMFKLNIIDNDEFGGDVTVTLNLTSVSGANLGNTKTCVVTIADNEHPLQAILGTYKAVYESYYDGPGMEGTVYLRKDETDVKKVWIGNIVPGSTASYVYGIVNDDMTEIAIPVGQALGSTSSYNLQLDGYTDDGEVDVPTGGSIIAKIQADGKIVIDEYWYTSSAYYKSDGSMAGYYDVICNSVWTKQ